MKKKAYDFLCIVLMSIMISLPFFCVLQSYNTSDKIWGLIKGIFFITAWVGYCFAAYFIHQRLKIKKTKYFGYIYQVTALVIVAVFLVMSISGLYSETSTPSGIFTFFYSLGVYFQIPYIALTAVFNPPYTEIISVVALIFTAANIIFMKVIYKNGLNFGKRKSGTKSSKKKRI